MERGREGEREKREGGREGGREREEGGREGRGREGERERGGREGGREGAQRIKDKSTWALPAEKGLCYILPAQTVMPLH